MLFARYSQTIALAFILPIMHVFLFGLVLFYISTVIRNKLIY